MIEENMFPLLYPKPVESADVDTQTEVGYIVTSCLVI